jgi:hypothetical protein
MIETALPRCLKTVNVRGVEATELSGRAGELFGRLAKPTTLVSIILRLRQLLR